MSSGNADPGTAYCMDVLMTSIENVGYTSSRDCSGYRLAVTVIYIGAEIKDRVCDITILHSSPHTHPGLWIRRSGLCQGVIGTASSQERPRVVQHEQNLIVVQKHQVQGSPLVQVHVNVNRKSGVSH